MSAPADPTKPVTGPHERPLDEVGAHDDLVTAAPVVDAKGRMLLGEGSVLDGRTIALLQRATGNTTRILVRPAGAPAEPAIDPAVIAPLVARLDAMFAPHAEAPLMVALHRAARARLHRAGPAE